MGSGSRPACLLAGRRATRRPLRQGAKPMKSDIHPNYEVTTVTCGCGAEFTTRSTAPGGAIPTDVCSQCHPFYTGKQKILDTGGRVARFEKRFGAMARGAGTGGTKAGKK